MYKTDFEKLMLDLESREVDPSVPVSRNASENTKKLFSYLKSIYGKKVLAGQQYLQKEELEDKIYYNASGKIPAIRGYDMMDIDKRKGDNQIDRAFEWAKESGCILTFCWHWYAPDDINKKDDCMWSFYYKTTPYDHKTSFDICRAVEVGTPEYEFVTSRIDKAAHVLERFAKEDIPIIWRPLHEANGNWFWWGNRGPESISAYKKLWYMIFDRFENYHKLTNLIWVWNGQNKVMAVNPNTFDICGEDIYPEKPDHGSQKEKFLEVTSYTGGKMAALSECGYIPEPKSLVKDGVKWLWWLPWWGSFVYKYENNKVVLNENGMPIPNEEYMNVDFIKETFENDYCVTLDKLPWFTKENAAYIEKRMKEKND